VFAFRRGGREDARESRLVPLAEISKGPSEDRANVNTISQQWKIITAARGALIVDASYDNKGYLQASLSRAPELYGVQVSPGGM
jgi:hypothetical protein